MATYDNTHSRLVAHSKVVLPLLALGLLSTMFLFYQGTVDPSDTIIYADVDVSDLAQDETIKSPRYAGVTEDGTAINISAARIAPSASQDQAQSVETRFETQSGLLVDIRSRSGTVDASQHTVTLSGGTVLQSSSGYVVTTDEISSSLERTDISLPSQITAVGPFGRIEAGSGALIERDGSYVLDFQNGVRLLYTPSN